MKLLTCLLTVFATAFTARAAEQTTLEAKLEQELGQKVVGLRHPVPGNEIKFDIEGKSAQPITPVPLCNGGVLRVEQLMLTSASLDISGARMICGSVGDVVDTGDPILVHIALGAHADESGVRHAIARVLFEPDDVHYILLNYWRKTVVSAEKARKNHEPLGFLETYRPVFVVAPDVSPPKAISAPNPRYTEVARNAKYQGKVVLFAVIGETGIPEVLLVQHHLGMGLDEEAERAVAHWRFEPAMSLGRPVAVAINVEVNFRLE